MRNLWSAKTTSCTTPVEQFTLAERENQTDREFDIEATGKAITVTASSSPTATMAPLGNPDATAFSAPGTLLENGDGDSVTSAAMAGENGNCATQSEGAAGHRPASGVIVVGPTRQVASASTSPQCPSTPLSAQPTPVKIAQRTASAISNHSAAPSITSAYDICRICHCEGSADSPLISPCSCSGSLKYVHQKCLQQWIKSSQTRSCEVCRFTFIMETKVKPFRKWEKLDISSIERRKILCSVTFHVVAITCVVWSLYVLIDRTAEEIRAGQLDWPFWTKLVVVAIGFTGGIVFMYVQCKMYFQLFRRWQSYNKVIYVQNGPGGGVSSDNVECGMGKYVASCNGDCNGSALNK